MGQTPLLWRIRQWLAISVALEAVYWLLGERPLFCDLATSGCPLDTAPTNPPTE